METGRSSVELANALNRALNEGGTDAILPFYSEGVEWYMPDGWLEREVYRGASTRCAARSRGTGVPIEQPVALIVTFRDGLVARVDSFFAWDEARKAAGIRP